MLPSSPNALSTTAQDVHYLQFFSEIRWYLASDVVSEFFRVYSCNRTMFLQSMNTVALYGRSCNHFATVRIDFFETLVPYAEKFSHIFQQTYFKYSCTKNMLFNTVPESRHAITLLKERNAFTSNKRLINKASLLSTTARVSLIWTPCATAHTAASLDAVFGHYVPLT